MCLIVETAVGRDLRKRDLPGLHETEGSFQAEPQDELVRGHTNRGAEETRKMKRADVSLLCQRKQRHIVAKL